MDLKDLYQELILDHGKNPRNLGKFENFNKTVGIKFQVLGSPTYNAGQA